MRIGIMMGSFNPPHLAHLEPLLMAKAAGLVDMVWIVPVPSVPTKRRLRQLSISAKIELCRLLVRDHRWISVYETADHQVRSDRLFGYLRSMAGIVQNIRSRSGDVSPQLCLFCGIDSFRHLRALAALLRILPGSVLPEVRIALGGSTFAVIARGGQSLAPTPALLAIGGRTTPIKLVALPVPGVSLTYVGISSTKIRATIAGGGHDVFGLTPELEQNYRLAVEQPNAKLRPHRRQVGAEARLGTTVRPG